MEKNIKEEIYKCSKCGQCQSVCPVYIATKNEMYLPRGRYVVLNNYYSNNRKCSKKFIKETDICLNCNACKRFCPSNIDTTEILTRIKSENNYKFSIFSFSFIYKLTLNAAKIIKNIYRFLPLKSIFINKFIDTIFDIKIKRQKQKNDKKLENIVYFEGCINRYINPSDKNASVNILEKLGYNVVKIIKNCCGLPYLSDGNYKNFNKNVEKIISSIPEDIKYIVCSCDSCFETLNKIPELKDKLIRFDEILKLNNFTVRSNENAVFFNPINREEKCYFPNYMDVINRKGACSLMENYFLLKYPKLSESILKNNFYTKEELDNKLVVTSCQLAAIGLKKGITKIGSNTRVYSLAEYVNMLT